MKKNILQMAVSSAVIDKIVKNCGDCGRFVRQEYYVTIPNKYHYTHPLCRGCMSNYDEVER